MGYARIVAALAFSATSLMLLLGCMPETPKTMFDWGVNTTLSPSPAAQSGQGAKVYAYQDKDEPSPSPRPAPTTSVGVQELPSASAPSFMWPVHGAVISDFGSTANGGKNDGINIAAKLNTPIRASASGTVTYAGDELKGYGNLVLIKHEGGYTTAYAHAQRLLVSRGDLVTKGQVIGYVGQTGQVSSPQLHFEIRSNTTPLNPLSFLSTRSASN